MRKPKTSLVAREHAFINAYLTHHHIRNAAIEAGYAPKAAKDTGKKLMRNPMVQAEIARREKEVADKATVDAAWVLQESIKVYRRCMGGTIDDQEYDFNPVGSLKALEVIGKHKGVRAFVEDATPDGATQPLPILLQQFIFNTVLLGAKKEQPPKLKIKPDSDGSV